MGWIRRHPAYASAITFIVIEIAIAAFSPPGDVVVPLVAGVIAAGLAVAMYVALKRGER